MPVHDDGDWDFPPVEPASELPAADPSAADLPAAERPAESEAEPAQEPTAAYAFLPSGPRREPIPPSESLLPRSSRPAAAPSASGAPAATPPATGAPTGTPAVVAPAAPAVPAVPEAIAPAPNLDVPRRNPAQVGPVSPLRAMAGALVAVAGVLLGIGALLWATDSPDGDPTLSATRSQQTVPSPAVSVAPSPLASVAPSAAAVPTVAQSSPAAVTRPSAVPAAPPKLPLTVLNNSTRAKLADRAAARFRAGGWPIKLTGNFRGRISETTVYYAPGQLASARLLQRSFAGLTRVRPRFEGLPGSGLTVVLTRSYDA